MNFFSNVTFNDTVNSTLMTEEMTTHFNIVCITMNKSGIKNKNKSKKSYLWLTKRYMYSVNLNTALYLMSFAVCISRRPGIKLNKKVHGIGYNAERCSRKRVKTVRPRKNLFYGRDRPLLSHLLIIFKEKNW